MRALALTPIVILAGCGGGGDGAPYEMVGVDHDFGGDLTISGTITFPGSGSHYVRLQVFEATRPDDNIARSTVISGDGFLYELSGLEPGGSYKVYACVNREGSPNFGDPGDAEGYYDGTEAAPIFAFDDAPAITLGTESLSGLDFGLGILP